MPRRRRYIVALSLLIVGAAAISAAAVLLLPEGWVRWIPALVGAAWTVGLAWMARRLGAEPGMPRPTSVRAGVVACGLLTALSASWAVRDRVEWPELLLLAAALLSFGWWLRATARELRARRAHPPAPPGPVLGLRPPARRTSRRPRRDPPGQTPRSTRWM
jgi:hypothetical protein